VSNPTGQTYELGEPIASLIVQTDGQGYELMLATKDGVLSKTDLFGPAEKHRTLRRKTLKFLYQVCYQTIQEEILEDDSASRSKRS